MDSAGAASSIIARHDYLPFGEEIAVNTGTRTVAQGYGVTDPNRQKYGLTERDDVTGLDHAWWRKYENRAGRWTTPDPYNGSMDLGDPQSFNRYSYVGNDSPNRIDPSGLICWDRYLVIQTRDLLGTVIAEERRFLGTHCDLKLSLVPFGGWNSQGRTDNIFNPEATKREKDKEIQRRIDAGNRWEQWRQWEACAASTKEKYRIKLEEKMSAYRKYEVMAFLASLPRAGSVTSIAVPVGLMMQESDAINDLNAEFLKEAQALCGPMVSKPSGHN